MENSKARSASGILNHCALPCAILAASLCTIGALPQNKRGFEQEPVAPANVSPGVYYALVIGINDYPSLPHLATAVHDAQAVGTLLESNFGFRGHVTYLLNQKATRANIMDALEGPKGYAETLTASDNLLIYYAGHGYYNNRLDKAYWLPYDAESALSANHISADDVTTAIRGIASHHVLIIADSCYSGDLTRGVDDNLTSKGDQAFIKRMLAGPSRDLLSSGGNEPVADAGPGGHSIFAAALLHALSEQSGPFFTAADLAEPVRRSVRAHSGQIPEYRPLGNSMPRNFPIDIGDFVFVRKTGAPTNSTKPEAPEAAESVPPTGDISNRGEPSFEIRDHGQALIDAKKYDEALSFSNEACDRDDAQGCTVLGVLYLNGLGVAKDTTKAATLFRKGCDGGYVGGCRNLGVSYLNGNGVEKDLAQAATMFRNACDAGDAHGCGWLGLLFLNGTGVVQDRVQALALSRKACDGGDMQGCSNVGFSYDNGFGVEKDYAQAAAFFQKGCDGGFPLGCSDLGTLYENGFGVEKDPSRAATLYKKGCDAGEPNGCADLGGLYKTGVGVAQDYSQAASLSQKACDGGIASGCVNLGYLYTNGFGTGKDIARAVSLFKKACDGGGFLGCAYLSGVYMGGFGVAQDPNQAVSLAQKACDGGNALGCTNLGALYQNGWGIQKDLLKAATLYGNGCDGGEALGCQDLANLYEHGWGVARDRNRATELLRKACGENDQTACNALNGRR